jgi:hypothetical protein
MKDEDVLVEMTEQLYDSEDKLQGLLEKYPLLLAGDQINSDEPRLWLPIAREVGVPDTKDGSYKWYLDHLFLDQDGISTLVEVKRSTDTRIRREVVGQMLDYAANAVVYWPVESIRLQFEARCTERGIDPEQELKERLDSDDSEQFWQRVRTNLEAGKVRMLFVADEIPPELQRVVEFLNEQMQAAEVLAIEIKQYVGGGHKTLVPRLIGQTSKSQATKGRTSVKTNRATFLQSCDDTGVLLFKPLLELAGKHGVKLNWGTVGFSLSVDFEGTVVAVCYGYPPHSGWKQSVYTDFSNVLRKVKAGAEIVEEYKAKFLQTGVFMPAGQTQNEVKWVNQKLTDDKSSQIVQLFLDYASAIREHGLLE